MSPEAATTSRQTEPGTSANARGGRPTDVPGQWRCRQVKIRLTIAEETQLKTMARTAGLQLATFVRKRAMGNPVVPPRAVADAAMLHELNAIGNNLNQLTHHLNAGRDGDRVRSLEATLDELHRALAAVTDRYLED